MSNRSLSEVHESVDTTKTQPGWKKIFSFMGPAYLVSVGYMDPGNWATDIAGGSRYGYTLIWVLVASNLMAIVLQSLSARLGIVRGRDLAQANRETFPRGVNFMLWLLAETAIAATDLAEVLGMAIGLQLLFDLPLMAGVLITALDTFLLLYLQRLGMRKIEAFIVALIAVIGFCFLINIIMASPSFTEIIRGLIPSFPDARTLYATSGIRGPLPTETALYLAIGIIGATVMPHNLYLHSALIQTRKITKNESGIREALRWSFIDSVVALNLALFINGAILVLAATVFFNTGRTDVGEIREAHELLSPMLGSTVASTLFAIALIASGQSSTITGTLSGQIVMEGYLNLRINPVVRRLITRLVAIIPAVIFIGISGESEVDQLLILSQVILSMQLGFAIIPLIHFVSDRASMGRFTIGLPLKITAWIMSAVLIGLNANMLAEEAADYFKPGAPWMPQVGIVLTALVFGGLLLYILFYPMVRKKGPSPSIHLHPERQDMGDLSIPTYPRIAVALDFSQNDRALLAAALGQGGKEHQYLIIHVVQSPSARIHADSSFDFEVQQDQEQLNQIVNQLKEQGYQARGVLGFGEPAREIVSLLEREGADLLVIGAHGHRGIRDFIYGTTIDKVRHDLSIPVFIVHT